MRVFFIFFTKTLAFFAATALFFIILTLLITFAFKDSEKINSKKFIFEKGDVNSQNEIVLIKLRGPILNEPADILEFRLIDSIKAIYVSEFIKNLEEIELEKPKALIISINSPGGSVSATYKLYKILEKFKKNNQTKIFLHTNELLASGGYWAALASDKIYASYGALIGSIGVKGPDWIYHDNPLSISTGILGQTVQTKDGIKKYNTIAGRSKDLFDSFREPTKEEKESLQEIVNGIYIDFVNTVAKKRSIENHFITEDLGALIFDARIANENYLIDGVKDLEEVIIQVVKELDLKDFKIITKERKRGLFSELIQSTLTMRFDVNTIRKNRVCHIINDYINVILLDNQSIRNC